MTQIAQGVVKTLTQKPAGRGTVYNFCLEDGVWYGHGFKAPKFKQGDYIKFPWEANGDWKNCDGDNVEVLDAPAKDPMPVSTAPIAAKKGTDWDAKDKRITLLACRKDAIALAKVGIDTGAIKLGAKNKDQVLFSVVNQIAGDLYHSIYGEDYPLHTDDTATTEVANDSEE